MIETTKRKPPPCWDDGTCPTPTTCYLHGCKETGWQSVIRTFDNPGQKVDSGKAGTGKPAGER
jgi:hypothetical protein